MLWKALPLLAAVLSLVAAAPQETLRGKLVQREGKPPAVETGPGRLVALEGEPESMAVVNDARLTGADLELRGEFKGADRFAVGPFYTSKSMFVHKDGKMYTISYWCPVCSLRTYVPGKCMCCQDETHLDFQEYKP